MKMDLSPAAWHWRAEADSLRSLFAGGRSGLWFDPAQQSALRQDAAGTLPVTAPGQPVGLILDLGGGGNHAAQALSDARPLWQRDASGRAYLLFDGVNDRMTVNAFPLGAAGRTVISVIRKAGDSTLGAVVEHRPQWTTPGGIAQFAPGGNGAATYGTRAHSSTAQSLLTSPASFPAPHTAVLTSLAATGTHVMRVNGVQVAAETPPGVMTALNAGLMIGARDGAGLFAGMRLYGL
ncbi:hypothetical protein D2N39_22250, partial [Gemmobacter lutimaris]